MAQSVKCLTLAQVMISRFVSSSPALGYVLTARRLEPASDSVSTSLSAPPPIMLCLSLKNKQTLKIKKKKIKAALGFRKRLNHPICVVKRDELSVPLSQ